jgi:thioester reductase-like protein
MVLNAIDQGVPAAVYRPVRITGQSQSGQVGDSPDLLFSVLRACVLLRAIPALDVRLPMLPVDYVARALVQLSLRKDSTGKAFHLINQQELPWEVLIQRLRAHGHTLETLPLEAWRKRLENPSNLGDRRFFGLVKSLLDAPNNLLFQRPPLDDAQTRAGLVGSNLSPPLADETLLDTYLSWFYRTGYLPRPESDHSIAEARI